MQRSSDGWLLESLLTKPPVGYFLFVGVPSFQHCETSRTIISSSNADADLVDGDDGDADGGDDEHGHYPHLVRRGQRPPGLCIPQLQALHPVGGGVNTRELLSNAAKEECCQLLMSDTISEVSGNFHIGFNGHR